MYNLYAPFTTFHFFLTFALAAEYAKDENIVIMDRSNRNTKQYELLHGLFPDVNVKMEWQTYRADIVKIHLLRNVVEFFDKKRSLRSIANLLGGAQIDRFFYFSDWKVQTTHVIHLLKNSDCKFYFGEDGIGTYTDQYTNHKGAVEKLFDHLIYGNWHNTPHTPGTLLSNATAVAIFPELLPRQFAACKQMRIPLNPLVQSIDEKKRAEMILSTKGNDIEEIIATDHDFYTNTVEYRNFIENEINQATNREIKVAIKRHPLDDNIYCSHNKTVIRELPNVYPIEIYYLILGNRLKKIFGTVSTALVTARWLMPNVEIQSLVPESSVKSLGNIDSKLRLLRDLNIKCEVCKF